MVEKFLSLSLTLLTLNWHWYWWLESVRVCEDQMWKLGNCKTHLKEFQKLRILKGPTEKQSVMGLFNWLIVRYAFAIVCHPLFDAQCSHLKCWFDHFYVKISAFMTFLMPFRVDIITNDKNGDTIMVFEQIYLRKW